MVKSLKCPWFALAVLAGLTLPAEGESHSSFSKEVFLKPGDRVVFMGDSITGVSGRNIYPDIIENWVRAFYPELEVQFVNSGLGSDTADNALRRFEKEALAHSPTVVVFCYGMNDALAAGVPNTDGWQKNLEIYLDSHREMIGMLRDKGVRPFLMTSPCARPVVGGNDHNSRLEPFAEALKKLAGEEKVPIVDVFHPLLERELEYGKHYKGESLIPDGIHPDGPGGPFLAMEVLRAWGLARLPEGRGNFLKRGDRVVFLGDSITEQGIYTSCIEAWVRAFRPELQVVFFNEGKGGETAPGGLARLEKDVLRHAPTVVTILYGANDGGRTSEVDPSRVEAYRTSMREIVRRLRAHNILPFVMTCIGVAEDRSVDLKGTNRAWRVLVSACLEMAREEELPAVDLFHPMVGQSAIYRLYYPNDRLVWDGVHPKGPGSLFIAMQVLRAWGLAS